MLAVQWDNLRFVLVAKMFCRIKKLCKSYLFCKNFCNEGVQFVELYFLWFSLVLCSMTWLRSSLSSVPWINCEKAFAGLPIVTYSATDMTQLSRSKDHFCTHNCWLTTWLRIYGMIIACPDVTEQLSQIKLNAQKYIFSTHSFVIPVDSTMKEKEENRSFINKKLTLKTSFQDIHHKGANLFAISLHRQTGIFLMDLSPILHRWFSRVLLPLMRHYQEGWR